MVLPLPDHHLASADRSSADNAAGRTKVNPHRDICFIDITVVQEELNTLESATESC
jgi:hypothetical protein